MTGLLRALWQTRKMRTGPDPLSHELRPRPWDPGYDPSWDHNDGLGLYLGILGTALSALSADEMAAADALRRDHGHHFSLNFKNVMVFYVSAGDGECGPKANLLSVFIPPNSTYLHRGAGLKHFRNTESSELPSKHARIFVEILRRRDLPILNIHVSPSDDWPDRW